MQADSATLGHLEWPRILGGISAEAMTALGKKASLAISPLDEPEAIREVQGQHRELARLVDEGAEPPIEPVEEIEEDLKRACKQGVLMAEAVTRIGRAMVVSTRVRKYLMTEGARSGGTLCDLARGTHDLSAVGRDLLHAFDDSGALRDSASPALGKLRRRVRSVTDEIRRRLETLMQSPKVAGCLREAYITQRGDRYVLPIRADSPQSFPGIVHDTSQSGATLFVEPAEMIEDGNRLKIAQGAVLDEEKRILAECSAEIARSAEQLRDNLQALTRFDVRLAAVRFGQRIRGRLIEVEEAGIHLLEARHPLLVLSGGPVVPNDILLPEHQRCLIITGPNAGGKTVVLKTVGLIALMAQSGLAVPAAEGSRIGRVESVHAVIGDAQDLDRGLSTFSAHVVALSRILGQARPGSLILIDEITADTDPKHGAALASAILLQLVELGSTVVVTTHYEELKHLAYQEERFANASVGFDMGRMQPTYTLHPDVPGRSLTLDIARRLGVPEGIIQNARGLLDESDRQVEQMLISLDQERQSLTGLREELTAKLARVSEQAEAQKQATEELQQKRREVFGAQREQLLAELKRVREEVAGLIESLKKEPSLKKAVESSKRLIDMEKDIHELIPPVMSATAAAPPQPRDDRQRALAVGDRVLVTLFGKEGEVTSVDELAGMVSVRMGSLRTRVALDQATLLPPRGSSPRQRPSPPPCRPPHQDESSREERRPALPVPAPAEVRTHANTLDVRGFRADEALAALEKFLDGLFEDGEPLAFVIHGHGTGALKSAIRGYLVSSHYARHFRAGAPGEGGDGVTVIRLK